jgi:hypothetical protein
VGSPAPLSLLVVDFDFFFPMPVFPENPLWELYDWGHAENNMYTHFLWPSRASAFIRHGVELPRAVGYEDFWRRVRVSKNARLFYADSNSVAVNKRVEARVAGEVWLFDAHHDSGYRGADSLDGPMSGRFTCEDWMIFYASKLGPFWEDRLHVRYPTHRKKAFQEEVDPYLQGLDRAFDDGEPPPLEFGRVFVCRSGAWVPPWCDDQFYDFLAAAPVRERTDLQGIEPRVFDRAAAEAEAEMTQRMIDEMEGRSPAPTAKGE